MQMPCARLTLPKCARCNHACDPAQSLSGRAKAPAKTATSEDRGRSPEAGDGLADEMDACVAARV